MSSTEIPSSTGNQGLDTSSPADSMIDAGYSRQAFYEFVIFMLPVYYFLIVGAKRYLALSNDNTLYIGTTHQNSYHIKRKACKILSGLYLIQFLLALIQSSETNWAAYYKGLSLLFILGIGAWILSLKLLVQEVAKGLPQDLTSQRIFWITHCVVACLRTITSLELTFWSFIVNLARVILSIVLAMYAVAKPYDTRDVELNYGKPDEYLGVRQWLSNIERIVLKNSTSGEFEDSREEPLLLPMSAMSAKNVEHDDYINEFKNFVKKQHPHMKHLNSHKEQPSHSRNSSRTMKQPPVPRIPAVHCTVSRNIVTRDRGDDDIKIFYKVQTQIEDETYTKLHKYANFLDLEDYLRRHCSPAKAAWFEADPPKLKKVDFDGYDDEDAFINARVKVLEEYINQLVSDPRYINLRVIDFLGIQNDHKEAFEVYNAFLKSHTSKSRALHYFKPTLGVELSQFADGNNVDRTSGPKMPLFKAYCSHFQKAEYGDYYEYVFVVKDENDPHSVSWKIFKSYQDFKTFHQDLENAIGKSIPTFNECVPKPTTQNQTDDMAFIEKRRNGLEMYLDTILEHRRYYKEALYEFIEYNKDRDASSVRSMTPRESFYGESV